MKRVSSVFPLLLMVMFAAVCASAQSLGDAARKAQADKKAAPAKHVYTNDDIVTAAAPAPEKVTGTDATASGNTAGKSGADAKSEAQKSDDKDKDKAEKKDSKEDAAKATELKQKLAEQQKAVADQDHEISIMEREHQIRVAEYYADAGTQLRTSGQWFEDEKKYQSDLQAKKQALSDAKAKLDDLNDQARKAGAPGS